MAVAKQGITMVHARKMTMVLIQLWPAWYIRSLSLYTTFGQRVFLSLRRSHLLEVAEEEGAWSDARRAAAVPEIVCELVQAVPLEALSRALQPSVSCQAKSSLNHWR